MARKSTNVQKISAKLKNTDMLYHYFWKYLGIAISMFEWKGLPTEIDYRYLEYILISQGMAVAGNSTLGVPVAGMVAPEGRFNNYEVPRYRRYYTINGHTERFDSKNSVMIYNSFVRKGDVYDILLFADRIAKLMRTMDVNINVQKTPFIVTTDKAHEASVRALFNQVESFQDYVVEMPSFPDNAIQVLNLNPPFIAPELNAMKDEIENELLNYLGIAAFSSTKKERLVSNEVSSTQQTVAAMGNARLRARRQAAEQMSELFGTEITVDYCENLQETIDALKNNPAQTGGVGGEGL